MKSIAFVLAAALVGCSSDEAETPATPPTDADTADAPPAPPATAPTANDVGVGGDDQTTERTEGAPEMTSVSYFVTKAGLPLYLVHRVGSVYHLFPNVEIKNPSSTAQRVVLRGELAGYTKTPGLTTVDLAPGETKKMFFDATLDLEALGKVSGQVSANFQISLETTDGKILNARSRTATLLSKNTVLWGEVFTKTPNSLTEKEAVVGSFTTPHDRGLKVDALLKEAATFSAKKAIIGYLYHKPTSTLAEDAAGAKDQIIAIYTALKKRGFNYTTVSEAFFAGQQNVRFPAQSLTVASANCIDGSLVFASALEAIGMEPYVVFVTGHAFIGVHVAPSGTPNAAGAYYVETTLLGTAEAPTALTQGLAAWNKNKALPTTVVLELKALRERGWLPSPL